MRLPRLHRPRPVVYLAIGVVALALLVVVQPGLAFAQPPVDVPSILNPKSPATTIASELFTFITWIAVGVFVLVEGLIIYSVVRFRRKPGDTDEPVQVYGNTQLEVAWTVVPAMIVAVIMVLSLQALPVIYDVPGTSAVASAADVGVCYVGNLSTDEAVQAAGTDVIEVKVIGHQWWWEFQYPQYGFKTATDLVAPVGRVVKLDLTGADVIHAWWIPELGPQFNVTPGYTFQSWFQAEEARTYQGQCAYLCGEAHAYMPAEVVALSQGDFDQWVERQRQPRAEPATALAKQGEALFVTKACATCHAITGYPGNKAVAVRGPNLTHFGSRDRVAAFLENTPQNLARWLHDPETAKPGNIMATVVKPGYLQPSEIAALVEYLENLK